MDDAGQVVQQRGDAAARLVQGVRGFEQRRDAAHRATQRFRAHLVERRADDLGELEREAAEQDEHPRQTGIAAVQRTDALQDHPRRDLQRQVQLRQSGAELRLNRLLRAEQREIALEVVVQDALQVFALRQIVRVIAGQFCGNAEQLVPIR